MYFEILLKWNSIDWKKRISYDIKFPLHFELCFLREATRKTFKYTIQFPFLVLIHVYILIHTFFEVICMHIIPVDAGNDMLHVTLS